MLNLTIALFLGASIGVALWLEKPLLATGISATAFVYCCSIAYKALMKIYELLSPS